MARAMAMRWRWPPDSVTPRSPTGVSNFCGSAAMKSAACANSAARATSASLACGPAEADIVAHRGGEHHAVLRHQRDARTQVRRIEIGKAHAVERDAAGDRIVEAQQEMKDRALAGAGRTDDRDLLALAHLKRHAD